LIGNEVEERLRRASGRGWLKPLQVDQDKLQAYTYKFALSAILPITALPFPLQSLVNVSTYCKVMVYLSAELRFK
jgi:hypothetical protein